jgi:peptidyl-prolyl cis-trans isomerase D
MLDLMRKHARNWMMKTILGIIIVVFIFYFGSMTGRQRADVMATVDGKTISRVAFEKNYANTVDMYRQQFGGALTEGMLKAMKIRESVLDKMIYEAILLEKAQELNIRVSDEELRTMIAAMPAFQRNGAFSEERYQQMLRYNRLKPEEFEEAQRKNHIVARLEELLQDGIQVSDSETYDHFRMANAKIDLAYVRISEKTFVKDVQPSPSDLETYLKEKSGDFRVPQQVQLRYLFFSGESYGASASVSDEELRAAYKRMKGQPGQGDKTPPLEKVRDRIVREIKHSKGMRLAYDEAKKAHDEIYQQNNFDAYASKHHLTTGTTGLFPAHAIPQELKGIRDMDKVAFALEKDDVSKILSSEAGYYLVRLMARKEAYTPALKDVESQVRQRYLDETSRRLARQEAERLLDRMKKGESLRAVAAERKLAVAETGLFVPSVPPPQLGASPELRRSLAQLSAKKPHPDQVFSANGDFILVEFKSRAEVDDSEYTKQKDNLKEGLLRIKRSEAMQGWMESTKTQMIKDGRIKYNVDKKDL